MRDSQLNGRNVGGRAELRSLRNNGGFRQQSSLKLVNFEALKTDFCSRRFDKSNVDTLLGGCALSRDRLCEHNNLALTNSLK